MKSHYFQCIFTNTFKNEICYLYLRNIQGVKTEPEIAPIIMGIKGMILLLHISNLKKYAITDVRINVNSKYSTCFLTES